MGRNRPGKAFTAITLTLFMFVFTSVALAYETIPYGEISDNVRDMQQALKDQGYFPDTVDGVFGPETLVAICQFQSDHNLYVDGQPGDATLSKLYAGQSDDDDDDDDDSTASTVYHDSGALRYGCRGFRVEQLQQALTDVGYYSGRIDGYYGSRTRAAVRAYQCDYQLSVDGVAGDETWFSLFGNPNPPYNGSQQGTYDNPNG